MTIQNKRIIASILFVLISFASVAQGPPTPPPPGPPPVGFPIDGGIFMGIAIALFYGVKKVYSKENKQI
jgi:hypothetical protein